MLLHVEAQGPLCGLALADNPPFLARDDLTRALQILNALVRKMQRSDGGSLANADLGSRPVDRATEFVLRQHAGPAEDLLKRLGLALVVTRSQLTVHEVRLDNGQGRHRDAP